MVHRRLFYIIILLSLSTLIFGNEKTLGKRKYLLDTPKKENIKNILIWCHPASGDPKPEFNWIKQSKILDGQTILVCPQASARQWTMKRDEKFILALIKELMKRYKIEKSNILMGGHSSGALFTYDFGLKHQKYFHHLITACGVMRKKPKKATKDSPKITIYHSIDDLVFPIKLARDSAKILLKFKYKLTFIEDRLKHSIGPKLATALKKGLKEMNEPVHKK
ncbi:MAG: hypothetical protein COA79_17530 [Planctomycetota bacterium]|nr:MAG: hypothetical protein COA79_17530 [Planctomycetota bacterium]